MEEKDRIKQIVALWNFAIAEINGIRSFVSFEYINDQFYRRLLVKNIYAVIETFINVTKEIIVTKILLDNSNDLPWEDLAILNEKSAKLDDKGRPKAVVSFQPFEPTFRFTMHTFAKIFSATPIDLGNSNFENLKRLSKLRNDITHPKIGSPLVVSEKDIQDLIGMFEWFMNSHNQINSEFIKWLAAIQKR